MKDVWFKEDRALPKEEQAEAIEATEKALRNSTLIRKRLERILDEKIEETHRSDEDFSKDHWEREHVANISRRKTLK